MINSITYSWSWIRKSGKSSAIVDNAIMITYCMTRTYVIVTSILRKRSCGLKAKEGANKFLI